MQEPLVTAVIPVFNHAHWVNDAIDSIAIQDYPNIRIVVVDDGSTDGSSEAVTKRLYSSKTTDVSERPSYTFGLLEHTKREVMVVRFEEAHGPAFARNAGIRSAWEGTEIFALLDSDDIYESGKISLSVDKMQDRVGVVYSDFDTLSASGLRLRQYKEPFSRERLIRECIINCDSLVSKKVFEECGLFDENLRVCEDYDYWLRATEKFLAIHIPKPLVTIRVGEHSSSTKVRDEVWKSCWKRVMEKTRARGGV